ncbi:DNA cytosine methyltransferase [Candidatus Xenohaliotis californiensis]
MELFVGTGGTSLGFENAGLNHVLLNEIDKQAVCYNSGKILVVPQI